MSVNVEALNDSLVEYTESVTLMLTVESSCLQSVVPGSKNETTVEITGTVICCGMEWSLLEYAQTCNLRLPFC